MRRMDRFNHYKDLSDADKWLTKFLLGRSTPASERLLTSTKLSDLIYQSMSFEDVYYGNQRPECPVNAENLASDLFTALFSPVMRISRISFLKRILIRLQITGKLCLLFINFLVYRFNIFKHRLSWIGILINH